MLPMHKKKNTSPKIYVQIRKMLLLGIVIALGLSLGVSFLLNLIQESRSLGPDPLQRRAGGRKHPCLDGGHPPYPGH